MPEESGVLQDTIAALKTQWGLTSGEIVSEEAILEMLAVRIAELITKGAEPFYQLMYRLDISERKLNEIHGSENAANKIARLVYDRQLEKIKSRRDTRQEPGNTDPELMW